MLIAAVALAGVVGAGVVLSRSGALTQAGLKLSAVSVPAAHLLEPTGESPPGGSGQTVGEAGVMVPRSSPTPATVTPPAVTPGAPLTLSAAERRACPPAATACVDLAARITWLQDDGKVTFGPVRMEPGSGAQGTSHATPIGTWTVQWKAGPHYTSDVYDEPMPWATFFASGGIAFHGGSLTLASHGCVHLTLANAKYYHDHLPIGAEVAVF